MSVKKLSISVNVSRLLATFTLKANATYIQFFSPHVTYIRFFMQHIIPISQIMAPEQTARGRFKYKK